MPPLTAIGLGRLKLASRTGAYDLLVCTWNEEECLAVPIARRPGGLLAAVPRGTPLEEAVAAAETEGFPSTVGPGRLVQVRGRSLEDPLLPHAALAFEVLLIDFLTDGLTCLRRVLAAGVPPSVAHRFDADEPNVWPLAEDLVQAVNDWLVERSEAETARTEGYATAAEGSDRGGGVTIAYGGEAAGAVNGELLELTRQLSVTAQAIDRRLTALEERPIGGIATPTPSEVQARAKVWLLYKSYAADDRSRRHSGVSLFCNQKTSTKTSIV